MTPKQRLENLLSGKPIDRPPFFPALYDYKSTLADKPPHLFGQTAEEVALALNAEAETLEAEILTAAYDIYNVETEALGGAVTRDPALLLPEIHTPLITALDQVNTLKRIAAPEGRMPVFIRAAGETARRFGDHLPVRGGLSGPFSMAAKIYPREELLMATMTEPEAVLALLRVCTDAIKVYMNGFIGAGVGVALFDSFIVPPMLSPGLYEALVLPFHQELFALQKAQGVAHRTLIAGGNILPLLPLLVKTGANQLILDYNIPVEKARETIQAYPEIIFRINLSPALIAESDPVTIHAFVEKTLRTLKDQPRFILGTGILPPRTPRQNLLATRQALVDFYSP